MRCVCFVVTYFVYRYVFQSMQILKKSDLKPYFILIKPSNITKLKEMREHQGASVTVSVVCCF